MIGVCKSPWYSSLPYERLTDVTTIKECQLKCQKNPKCKFFKYSYLGRKCSLWNMAGLYCGGYLGVSNSILKTCGKGEQNIHFCICTVKTIQS